jgi:hypothetical protein
VALGLGLRWHEGILQGSGRTVGSRDSHFSQRRREVRHPQSWRAVGGVMAVGIFRLRLCFAIAKHTFAQDDRAVGIVLLTLLGFLYTYRFWKSLPWSTS